VQRMPCLCTHFVYSNNLHSVNCRLPGMSHHVLAGLWLQAVLQAPRASVYFCRDQQKLLYKGAATRMLGSATLAWHAKG
jgi:hypothetical protein